MPPLDFALVRGRQAAPWTWSISLPLMYAESLSEI